MELIARVEGTLGLIARVKGTLGLIARVEGTLGLDCADSELISVSPGAAFNSGLAALTQCCNSHLTLGLFRLKNYFGRTIRTISEEANSSSSSTIRIKTLYAERLISNSEM